MEAHGAHSLRGRLWPGRLPQALGGVGQEGKEMRPFDGDLVPRSCLRVLSRQAGFQDVLGFRASRKLRPMHVWR